MRSAKHLDKSNRQWIEKIRASTPENDARATILVMGWASNPAEPQLLAALANHPACKHLYFIPMDGGPGLLNRMTIDGDLDDIHQLFQNATDSGWAKKYEDFLRGESEDKELLAYDVTAQMRQAGGKITSEEATRLLKNAFQEPLVPVVPNQAQIYLSGHGEHFYDAFIHRRKRGNMYVGNFPVTALIFDLKPTFRNWPILLKKIMVSRWCQFAKHWARRQQ